MNPPSFHHGKFDVQQGSNAPASEVISVRDWLFEAESICRALGEIQATIEARLAGDCAREREADALRDVRDAKNLLRSAFMLLAEDVDAGGGQLNVDGLKTVPVAKGHAHDLRDWEIHCSDELAFLAGLFGSRLHVHYIASHPELLPHRHWMFMQAVGAAFTHLLTASAHMRVAAQATQA